MSHDINFPYRYNLLTTHFLEYFPVSNTVSLNSAVNVVCTLISYEYYKKNNIINHYSEIFIYHNMIHYNYLNNDLLNTFISLNEYGLCLEELWPSDKNIDMIPDEICYETGSKINKFLLNKVVKNLYDIKYNIYNENMLIFRLNAYQSFSDAENDIFFKKTSIISIPQNNENIINQHCVICVGYDDRYELLIMRNSWSNQWGELGYFYLPYNALNHPNFIKNIYTVNMIDDISDDLLVPPWLFNYDNDIDDIVYSSFTTMTFNVTPTKSRTSISSNI
jgi:C1A family cysteine protease